MLLWDLFLTAMALMAGFAWLVLSMGRAERRARRNLYRGLGLAEATVDFLMQRNRDVLTELSYVRQDEIAEEAQPIPARQVAAGSGRVNLRLVQAAPDVSLLPGEHPATCDDRPTRH